MLFDEVKGCLATAKEQRDVMVDDDTALTVEEDEDGMNYQTAASHQGGRAGDVSKLPSTRPPPICPSSSPGLDGTN
eukprot:4647506-Prorocentrum_lima.AAC.1